MVMMIMIMMVAVVLCIDVQGRGQEFDVFKCIQNIIYSTYIVKSHDVVSVWLPVNHIAMF